MARKSKKSLGAIRQWVHGSKNDGYLSHVKHIYDDDDDDDNR